MIGSRCEICLDRACSIILINSLLVNSTTCSQSQSLLFCSYMFIQRYENLHMLHASCEVSVQDGLAICGLTLHELGYVNTFRFILLIGKSDTTQQEKLS